MRLVGLPSESRTKGDTPSPQASWWPPGALTRPSGTLQSQAGGRGLPPGGHFQRSPTPRGGSGSGFLETRCQVD